MLFRSAVATLISGGLKPLLRVSVLVLALIGCIVLSWLMMRYGRVWVSPIEPVAALGSVWAGLGIRDYARELRLRREVQSAFAQYLAPEMVERIVRNPELLKLGGERREMTILFADIRGFTSISEALKGQPEELTQLINGILTPLSEIVMRHGGTIDKYMGDCIMAFWNAPLDQPDHAARALATAIEFDAAMPDINRTIRASLPSDSTVPDIRIGVGLNSGECVVGNMGSKQRFDYSVLGDAVNVASRLEGLCKQYGVPIVIGETTASLSGASDLTEIDSVQVRGKQEALKIYTPAKFAPAA